MFESRKLRREVEEVPLAEASAPEAADSTPSLLEVIDAAELSSSERDADVVDLLPPTDEVDEEVRATVDGLLKELCSEEEATEQTRQAVNSFLDGLTADASENEEPIRKRRVSIVYSGNVLAEEERLHAPPLDPLRGGGGGQPLLQDACRPGALRRKCWARFPPQFSVV